MLETQNTPDVQAGTQRFGKAILAAGVAALVLFAAAFYLIVNLRDRVKSLEATAERQSREAKVLEKKLFATDQSAQNAQAGIDALGTRVGTSEEALAKRTAEMKERSSRLAAAQQATTHRVDEIGTEVSGVKTELGGARSDIASTRNDLAATNAKLESAMGDLNIHSGLIAKNHDELEILKHRGDRNYYEFTLRKKERKPVSTISLELRKADPKKSRFTLNVYADDRVYEKKDRSLGEPLQFYTGRERQLYEIVVFNASKDAVSGYLSTPK
jgi:predicted  nucleic acid-binding Zn-ribbon protein